MSEKITLKKKKPASFTSLQEEITKLKNSSLRPVVKKKPVIVEEVSTETLEDVIKELNSLIGLSNVKEMVLSLINYIKIQKEREKLGLKISKNSYHCVFTGSPGTGKTTIARIIGKIYKHLGILKKGHFVETDRSGLVSKYVGQTAIKTNGIIDSAIDGVLFVDEAYSLIRDTEGEIYGKEALSTLIKRMEDDRDKLVIIIAGYTSEMIDFINTNPGFKSRFNRYIDFVDYESEELVEIFKFQCAQYEYILNERAENKLNHIINESLAQKDKSFGNGRFVRNIFEKCIERQSNRIANLDLNREILTTITEEDIPSNISKIDAANFIG